MKVLKYCVQCSKLLWPGDIVSHRLLEPEERWCESCRKKHGISSLEQLLQYIHEEASNVDDSNDAPVQVRKEPTYKIN